MTFADRLEMRFIKAGFCAGVVDIAIGLYNNIDLFGVLGVGFVLYASFHFWFLKKSRLINYIKVKFQNMIRKVIEWKTT